MIAERVALNFLSHNSGIATKTNQFVKLAGKKCKICCTRKTLPKILDCLENETGEIIIDQETIDRARLSVEKMVAIGR